MNDDTTEFAKELRIRPEGQAAWGVAQVFSHGRSCRAVERGEDASASARVSHALAVARGKISTQSQEARRRHRKIGRSGHEPKCRPVPTYGFGAVSTHATPGMPAQTEAATYRSQDILEHAFAEEHAVAEDVVARHQGLLGSLGQRLDRRISEVLACSQRRCLVSA